MEWIVLIILLFNSNITNGFPLDRNILDTGGTDWPIWTPILATTFLLVSVVSLTLCVCCQRNKGFQEFTDCTSSHSLSNSGGAVNSVSPNNEFTIFPPCQSSLNTPGNRSSVVTFEPLPDIKPLQVQSKRPAAFNSVVNNGLSTNDWFEDPHRNFPRHQLKYVRELGRGWFGRVIEGEAQGIIPGQISSRVIVKSLHDDATPTDQIYFLHEVRPYRDLNHPNILRLLGRCLETDPFLIIFESCPGGDLKSFLTTNISTANALNEQGTTLKMMCDIVFGLEHMIDKGFVHTDLATRNCLVTPDLSVKIGDYGICIEIYKEDYYCTNDIALPIRWCAPETLHCTDTTIETKEVTACANVWSLGVVLWEICEFGKLPYGDLSDDEVIIKVLGEGSRRLEMPSMQCSYKHSLYLLMKQCWSPSAYRPELPQVRLMLSHLLASKQRHIQDGDSLSLNNEEEDFERRWQAFKPNTIPKTDNHIISTEIPGSHVYDDSRPLSVFCDSSTTLMHHTSDEGVADLQSLTNFNTDVSNTPPTASPQPSLSSSTGGDFFVSAVQHRHKSPSLQNLRGSVDDLSESTSLHSPISPQDDLKECKENEETITEVPEDKGDKAAPSDKVTSEHDFDSWLRGVETTNEEDARFVRKISEAIRDLDNALALEKTSSSSESSCNSSFENCSPKKDIPTSEQNVVLDFRLGKLESENITERFPETILQADSLQDDSFLDVNRKSNQVEGRATDSGTDTEDEMWRRRIEQGEFSKKVKEKSKSVADLMVLTHIECSDGSDSDPPSLTWTFERENILRGSLNKHRGGIPLKNSALTSNPAVVFGSESNIHWAVLGEDFKDTLQKLHAAQKQEKFSSVKPEVKSIGRDSSCFENNDSNNIPVAPSSSEKSHNPNEERNFLEIKASEKILNSEVEVSAPEVRSSRVDNTQTLLICQKFIDCERSVSTDICLAGIQKEALKKCPVPEFSFNDACERTPEICGSCDMISPPKISEQFSNDCASSFSSKDISVTCNTQTNEMCSLSSSTDLAEPEITPKIIPLTSDQKSGESPVEPYPIVENIPVSDVNSSTVFNHLQTAANIILPVFSKQEDPIYEVTSSDLSLVTEREVGNDICSPAVPFEDKEKSHINDSSSTQAISKGVGKCLNDKEHPTEVSLEDKKCSNNKSSSIMVPLRDEEKSSILLPSIENSSITLPSVDKEKSSITIPSINEEKSSITIASIDEEKSSITLPSVDKEKSSITLPSLDEEKSSITIPSIDEEKSSITIPSVDKEKSSITIPSIDEEKSSITISSIDEEKSSITVPSIDKEKSSITLPFIDKEKSSITLPSVDKEKSSITIPSIDEEKCCPQTAMSLTEDKNCSSTGVSPEDESKLFCDKGTLLEMPLTDEKCCNSSPTVTKHEEKCLSEEDSSTKEKHLIHEGPLKVVPFLGEKCQNGSSSSTILPSKHDGNHAREESSIGKVFVKSEQDPPTVVAFRDDETFQTAERSPITPFIDGKLDCLNKETSHAESFLQEEKPSNFEVSPEADEEKSTGSSVTTTNVLNGPCSRSENVLETVNTCVIESHDDHNESADVLTPSETSGDIFDERSHSFSFAINPVFTSTPHRGTSLFNPDLSSVVSPCQINSTDEDVSEITPSCMESTGNDFVSDPPKITDLKERNNKTVTKKLENSKNISNLESDFHNDITSSSQEEDHNSGLHSVILGPCEDYTLDYFKGLKTTFDDENSLTVNKIDFRLSSNSDVNQKSDVDEVESNEKKYVLEGDFSIDSWNKHLDDVCNERLAEMSFGTFVFEQTPFNDEYVMPAANNKGTNKFIYEDGPFSFIEQMPVVEKDVENHSNDDNNLSREENTSTTFTGTSPKILSAADINTKDSDNLFVPSIKFIAPTPSHSGRSTPDACQSSDNVDERNDHHPVNFEEVHCGEPPYFFTDKSEPIVRCVSEDKSSDEESKSGDHHTIPLPSALISIKGRLETCDSSGTDDSAFDFPRSDDVSVASNSKETSRHDLRDLDLCENYSEKCESSVCDWQQDERNILTEDILKSVMKEQDFPNHFNIHDCETVGSSDDEYGMAKHSTPDDERSSDSGFRDKGSLSESCEDACDEKYNLEDIEAELEDTYNRGGFNYTEEHDNQNHAVTSDVYFDEYPNSHEKCSEHYNTNENHTMNCQDVKGIPSIPGEESRDSESGKVKNFSESDKPLSSGWFLHPQTPKDDNLFGENSEEQIDSNGESKDDADSNNEDSYMSFSLDEEFLNAIRNELREKLPYIRQHSKEDEEEEENAGEGETVTDNDDDEDDDLQKCERMDINIQYTSYPAPLSPILEEGESMNSSLSEQFSVYLNSKGCDSEPVSPALILEPVEADKDDKSPVTSTSKFEDEIREALENCSFSSNDTESSNAKDDKKSCITFEDLEVPLSDVCDNNKANSVIVRSTNDRPEEDVLLVDTETNEATLLESPTPKSHLAFVKSKMPDTVINNDVLNVTDLSDDEIMTVGGNCETYNLGGKKFDIVSNGNDIMIRHADNDSVTPDNSISPGKTSDSATQGCSSSSGSTFSSPDSEDLSALVTPSVSSSQDSSRINNTTNFIMKQRLDAYSENPESSNVTDDLAYDLVKKVSLGVTNNEAEGIINELKESGLLKDSSRKDVSEHYMGSSLESDCAVESPSDSVRSKISDSSDSFHSFGKDKILSGDESVTDSSISYNADNILIDQDSLEEDDSPRKVQNRLYKEKDWSIPSLEAALLSTKAPMPSPEEESWKKIPSMLAFSDLDDVMHQHIQDNHFMEVDPLNSPGDMYRDADDADLMSTSFSTKEDDGEDAGECYTPDWESEVEDMNEDDNNSSSSGEFVWKEGEREEAIQAVGVTASNSTYKNYESLSDFPMEAITEEDEDDDEDCSTCSESSTEFVPSAWNSEAIPNRSALRSPDKKSEQKKSVKFKKQKYHCVYEYPRELSDSDSEMQDALAQYHWALYGPQVDYASYADWELMDGDIPETATTEPDADLENTKTQTPEAVDFYKLSSVDYDFNNVMSGDGEFYVSSSARPFQFPNGGGSASSQFFPNNVYSADTRDIADISLEVAPSEPSNISNCLENQSKDDSNVNNGEETDSPATLSKETALCLKESPEQMSACSDSFENDVMVDKVNEQSADYVSASKEEGDLTPPVSPTGLGELRHTRDRLKLDLPAKNSTIATDSPVVGKRRSVESVKGEASVLDSGEDTEDSGIESSNGAVSSRTLSNTLACRESVT